MNAVLLVGLGLVIGFPAWCQGVSATTRPPRRSESNSSPQAPGPRKLIPGGCSLYIASDNDWDRIFIAALLAAKVPLVIVPNRSEADYEAMFPKEAPPKSSMILMDARTGAVLLTETTRKRDPGKAAQELAKRIKAIVQ